MSSTRCWKCQERPSSRPGGLCHRCWADAGKPEKDAANVLRSEATGRALPLSSEVADELAAMEHVWTRPPGDDRTYQHRSLRAMKDAGPAGFWDRMQRVKGGQPGSEPEPPPNGGPSWDGTGPCPTCNREPEQTLQDLGAEKVDELLSEEIEFARWCFANRGRVEALRQGV